MSVDRWDSYDLERLAAILERIAEAIEALASVKKPPLRLGCDCRTCVAIRQATP